MIKTYLKIAFRNIMRYKVFSFINVIGLTIGLSASFIIGLMVYPSMPLWWNCTCFGLSFVHNPTAWAAIPFTRWCFVICIPELITPDLLTARSRREQ